jgi:hypothetical protein
VPLNLIAEKQADFGCDRFQELSVTISLLRGLREGATLALSSSIAKSLASNEEKRPRHGRGLLTYSNGDSPGRCRASRKIAYPAARRLSAEDLPERRSATIS